MADEHKTEVTPWPHRSRPHRHGCSVRVVEPGQPSEQAGWGDFDLYSVHEDPRRSLVLYLRAEFSLSRLPAETKEGHFIVEEALGQAVRIRHYRLRSA